MLIARLDTILSTQIGTDYNKVVSNRYKRIHHDIVRLVVHLDEDLFEEEDGGYRVEGVFSFNLKSKTGYQLSVLHANPVNKKPNAIVTKKVWRSDDRDIQWHMRTEDCPPMQEVVFFSSNIPIGLHNERTGERTKVYTNMMYGVLPFGTVVREIEFPTTTNIGHLPIRFHVAEPHGLEIKRV